MAGPATALVPVDTTVREAMKALTGDLVTFRGQVFRKVEFQVGKEKQAFLAPVDVELHVNPMSLGLAAAGLGLAGLAAWVIWNGLSLPTPFGAVNLFPGLKDSELGESIKEKITPPPDMPDTGACQVLHDRWRALRADPFWFFNPAVVAELTAIEHDAQVLGCAWLANP